MKLVLIHGRAQGDRIEEDVRREWIDSLNAGLDKSGYHLNLEEIVAFPFYGKQLDEYIEKAEAYKSDELNPVRSGAHSFVNEAEQIAYYESALSEIAYKTDINIADRAELNALQGQKRGPLNWEFVQELMVYLDKKKILNDWVIKTITQDVFMYLNVSFIHKEINKLVKSAIPKEPCVIVGHSLGSIISYLILKNSPELQVKEFITLGSPLGTEAVKKYIQPLIKPTCLLGNWYNAYDERDFVALNPLDRKHFNINMTIENKNNVNNSTDNKHGISGYLMDAEVAQRIYQALVR